MEDPFPCNFKDMNLVNRLSSEIHNLVDRVDPRHNFVPKITGLQLAQRRQVVALVHEAGRVAVSVAPHQTVCAAPWISD